MQTARKALDSAGFTNEPLMVGTGGGSASTTIELTKEAAEAGATHCIVICPGMFWSSALVTARPSALTCRLLLVRDGSRPPGHRRLLQPGHGRVSYPCPDLQLPWRSSGIDLNSDELIALSEHPNCLGAKVRFPRR